MTLPKPKKLNVERYIGGLSNYKKIKNPIKLSANESALGPSPKVIEALNGTNSSILKYPQKDSERLRIEIGNKFNINHKQIICGSGSDQIFDLICQLFLEPGDEVVVSKYGFIMHKIYAKIYGARVILAEEKNYFTSVDEILKKITNKTKLVFIANPNNPTGNYLKKEELLNLRNTLREDILLIIDDAYFEFIKDKNYASGLDLFKNHKNVLITRTFSKIYGLAGLRLGWGYSSKEIIDSMNQIKPPFNVNEMAIVAGIEALKDLDWLEKAIEHNSFWSNKIFFVLQELKIKSNQPTANFFLMNFDNSKVNSDEVFQKLASDRLIVRQMDQYKLPNSLRVTIGNKKSNEIFIESMNNIFK